MPHLSGIDLLPRLRKDYPDIPIIVLTGIVETDSVVECMKNGAFDYIVKPVESDRFISCIRGALMLRAGGNQGIAAHMLGITREALKKRLSRRRLSGKVPPGSMAA